MKPEQVFKRYDIRGRYGDEIDEEFAELLGKAVGTFSQRKSSSEVVVSKDNKDSSEVLKKALIEGLRSSGVDVIDVGTGPTDYTAFSGRECGDISVQVTSSHMPLDFNGFKLMYPEGNGFVNEDLHEVQKLFLERDFSEGRGELTEKEEAMSERYRESILEHGSDLGDGSEKKVVVDTLGGATSDILPELLEELDMEVIDISEDEPYRDPPNPTPNQLEDLQEKVEELDADLGLATDMDGDRVAAYTNTFLTGDEILGMMAQAVDGNVVASIDTSRAVEDLLKKEDREIYYTRVGDPFVMKEALERDVGLAGEPNGHYSVLDFVPYNSGTLAALVLAGTDIDKALEHIPVYHVEKFSFEVEDKKKSMKDIKSSVEDRYEIISEIDGVKFMTDNCDVLVRPSGSSEKIRVVAESESSDDLQNELPEIRDVVRKP